MTEKSLYDRLGGAFAIAAVVDHFSDAVLANPRVGKGATNVALHEWSERDAPARMAGLKFMRTLWICSAAGGPFQYAGKPLDEAHHDFHIAPEEFDEVAAELERSLDHFKVPRREKEELLAAFGHQKPDVTSGGRAPGKRAQAHLGA